MTSRAFLYSLLVNDPALAAIHSGRVFQDVAMTTAATPRPFLVYHVGNNTSEQLSEMHPASRQFFQVYVHDEIGDFQQIDALVDRVRLVLNGTSSPANRIITTRFLEVSQDFRDAVLKTIFRYLRFQWVLGGQEFT